MNHSWGFSDHSWRSRRSLLGGSVIILGGLRSHSWGLRDDSWQMQRSLQVKWGAEVRPIVSHMQGHHTFLALSGSSEAFLITRDFLFEETQV